MPHVRSDAATIVHVVCGPTAAGKSAVALALAARIGGTIISADSRQIYRGFDIGTAKPTEAEQQAVAHRGIDIVAPTARYSAAEWAAYARGAIDDARRAGSVPIVVGGTGFYLRALFAPLFAAPPLDEGRREALAQHLGSWSVPELRRWCAVLDPALAHLGRTQLLRAIETALLAGERLSTLQQRDARAPDLRARYLVVDPGREVLRTRIAARVERMLAVGWVNETRALMQHVPADAPAWQATGYDAVRGLVDGTLTERIAVERIVSGTRQYAKRQRTWLRHQLEGDDVTVLDPTDDDAAAALTVERWWTGAPAAAVERAR